MSGLPLLQDADDFPPFLAFQFPHAVVGLHHFRGFDEHGAARGRLVVYDAFDFPFQGRGDGDDQPSVAHGGCHVLIDHPALLGIAQDAVQRARDAAFRGGQFLADAGQLRRGGVFDFPVLVKYRVDAPHELGEGRHPFGQPVQGRVFAPVCFRFIPSLFFVFFLVQETDDVDDGRQGAFQVEQFRFVQVSAFDADAPDGRSHVVEVLFGEILPAVHDAQKLPCVLLQFAQGCDVGEEAHLFHAFPSEGAEAVPAQYGADFVESDFLFEVLWINHVLSKVCGCKVKKKWGIWFNRPDRYFA